MLQLLGFIIDCPDPMRLAAFYSDVTGRALMEGSSKDMAVISFGEVDLAFQRVDDYRAPRWPEDEHPKQFHLDFEVDIIATEQRRVLELGATLQRDVIGPEGYGWQVYTDPVGHPSAYAVTRVSRGTTSGLRGRQADYAAQGCLGVCPSNPGG